MYWFYEVGKAAGPASVYLPGGGFARFWFHLGYLHSFGNGHDLYDYDYNCFSAGCLSKPLGACLFWQKFITVSHNFAVQLP